MPDWPALEDRIDRAIVASPLAEPVLYTSFGGTQRAIRATFSTSGVEVDPDTSVVVRANRPMLGVRLSDLEEDPEAGDGPDEAVVRGQTYRVVDVERAGSDWASLHLHRKGP